MGILVLLHGVNFSITGITITIRKQVPVLANIFFLSQMLIMDW